jgi:hypothetical protein
MNRYRKATLLGLAAIGLGCTVQSALAAFSGADLSWQFYAAGSAYNPEIQGSETSGTFTADGTVGGTFIAPANGDLDPVFTISADSTGITFDFSVDTATSPFSAPPISGTTDISNGIAIDILSGAGFDNVTIDAATNMAGFSVSAFSFNTSQLNVDFAGLPFSTDTIVKLDVTSDNSLATPEPATAGLMLAALAGAALLLRRIPFLLDN